MWKDYTAPAAVDPTDKAYVGKVGTGCRLCSLLVSLGDVIAVSPSSVVFDGDVGHCPTRSVVLTCFAVLCLCCDIWSYCAHSMRVGGRGCWVNDCVGEADWGRYGGTAVWRQRWVGLPHFLSP